MLEYRCCSPSPDDDRIVAITKMIAPKTATEVRAFLGVTGYYRRFIQGYASIARPLIDLTKADVGPIRQAWGAAQAAFESEVLSLCAIATYALSAITTRTEFSILTAIPSP